MRQVYRGLVALRQKRNHESNEIQQEEQQEQQEKEVKTDAKTPSSESTVGWAVVNNPDVFDGFEEWFGWYVNYCTYMESNGIG